MPLSYNGVVINDAASNFRSQLDFLLHVLHRVPREVLVFYTKHSLQASGGIPEPTEAYLLRQFPNLRHPEEFDRVAFSSQWLTPLVSGIISLNSTVAYQGALFGKKVFALGECEINTVATASELNDVSDILNRGDVHDREAYNVIYHLLTRYCFPLVNFLDPAWLTKRLENLLQAQREGGFDQGFDGLPLLDEEDLVFKRLLDATPGVQEGYQVRIRAQKES